MCLILYGTIFVVCHKEITTEISNSRIGEESTAIDDTQNNSPVTKPVIIIFYFIIFYLYIIYYHRIFY